MPITIRLNSSSIALICQTIGKCTNSGWSLAVKPTGSYCKDSAEAMPLWDSAMFGIAFCMICSHQALKLRWLMFCCGGHWSVASIVDSRPLWTICDELLLANERCRPGHSSRVRSVTDWHSSSSCSSDALEGQNIDFWSLLNWFWLL